MQLRNFLLVLLLVGSAWGQSEQSEWKAFTSMRNLSRLLVDDAYVWALTSGGVLRFDRATQTYDRFTRLDGLPGNDVSSLAVDDKGDLWFGTRFQGLSRLRVEDNRFEPPYMDFAELSVSALYAYEDRIFVGTGLGISVFLVDKAEVKETYRQLINRSKDIPVNVITVHEGHLWAGTDTGLAWADLEQPNLQDPQSWQSTISLGRVLDLQVFNDTLFCVSSNSIWTASAGGRPERDVTSSSGFVSLGLLNGKLIGAKENGEFYERYGHRDWRRLRGTNITGISDLSVSEGPMWVATQTGLRIIGDDRLPSPREPSANGFYDLGLGGNGHLWAASVPKDGFTAYGAYEYDGEGWVVHNLKSGLSSENVTSIERDAEGRVWLGNWGRGVDVLDSTGTWRRLNSGNSAITGIGGGSFAPISDIERDANGHMWIADVQSGLVVMDGYPPERQLLNRQEDFGLAAGRDIGKISIAQDGLIWVATARDGFILFDDGGTPYESGDESGVVFNSLQYSDLTSDRSSDIFADAVGRVWVGTDNGLNALSGSYDRTTRSFTLESWNTYGVNEGLPSNVITAIAGGPRGDVWIGTEDGIAQIDPSGQVAFALNTANSGLIDDRVNSLLFDEELGELWIGTLNGLSRLRVQTGDGEEGTSVQVYPNPLRLGSRGNLLTLTGLPLGAEVSIYTNSGQLVQQIEGVPGVGSATWDGLNNAGFLVGSGIYFFVASDGVTHTLGKFAVVNNR
ncbi:MAG: two-component regulator propeller domain-containing protein [Candidatus Latescibacterota bacterium]